MASGRLGVRCQVRGERKREEWSASKLIINAASRPLTLLTCENDSDITGNGKGPSLLLQYVAPQLPY